MPLFMYNMLMEEIVLSGTVIHGRGRGKQMGIPTANIDTTECKVMPPIGVYASYAVVAGVRYRGITNVGRRPTVDDDEDITIETYILDFDRDIYGERIEVSLEIYLRGLHKFNSIDELVAQLRYDCSCAKEQLVL